MLRENLVQWRSTARCSGHDQCRPSAPGAIRKSSQQITAQSGSQRALRRKEALGLCPAFAIPAHRRARDKLRRGSSAPIDPQAPSDPRLCPHGWFPTVPSRPEGPYRGRGAVRTEQSVSCYGGRPTFRSSAETHLSSRLSSGPGSSALPQGSAEMGQRSYLRSPSLIGTPLTKRKTQPSDGLDIPSDLSYPDRITDRTTSSITLSHPEF